MIEQIYISGPMTGYEDNNYPLFNLVADWIVRGGNAAINPAETGAIDTAHLEDPEWHDYMMSAIDRMRDATAIHFIKGWWRSYGAWIEFIVAKKMKLKVIK
jgi:hypothetical protein